MNRCLLLALLLAPDPLMAEAVVPRDAAIVVLGEVHDNPAHHAEQARLVAQVRPRAVVWEMLSPEQAAQGAAVDPGDAAALGDALGWDRSGWPDFAMYHPIFLAAGPVPQIGGAVAMPDLKRAMAEGAAAVAGDDGAGWGLGALTPADQAAREAEQMVAHCNALPAAMLPGMVEAQRLRDWRMAQVAVAAADRHGTPVVIITGTGHARRDIGIPSLIAQARPDLRVWSLGQAEADPGPDAPFDAVNVTPPVPRDDPCAGFDVGN
jgi:predicted TIM-barrel fold metal-dependent hydrolase